MSPKVSKELSKHRLEQAREDSDYVDEFIVNPDDTKSQIETARELLKLIEKYIDEN